MTRPTGTPQRGVRRSTKRAPVWLYPLIGGFVVLGIGAALLTPPSAADKVFDHRAAYRDSVQGEIRSRIYGLSMTAQVDITNLGGRIVRDLRIDCELIAPSGTVVDDASATIYETVDARSTRRFADVGFGAIHSQSESARCAVGDFKF